MSSNRVVFAVLIALLVSLLPLNNPVAVLPEQDEVNSVGASLEDYELYFDDATSLTTKEPTGTRNETSLLGSGVTFDTDELISDLTIEGKSSSEVRIFAIMKFKLQQPTRQPM